MRALPVVMVCLFAMACGPTAEVITSPSPISSPSDQPTFGPTIAPTEQPTLDPNGSATPISLSTDTPAPTETTLPTVAPGTGFAPLAGFPAADAFEVDDVAAIPSGFIAVGFGGLDGEDYYGRHQGIVWTSPDGTNWTESVDPSLRNVSPAKVVMRGADYFIYGVVSACAQLSEDECIDVPEAGNAIFHSTDGRTWQMLPQLVDMQFGNIDGMLVADDRLVAYGLSADENQTTTVWQSTDGAAWSPSTDLAGIEVTSMIYSDSTKVLTAFGTRYVADLEDYVLVGASSADGAHFSALTVPELTGAGLNDVVLGANGFAGVGYVSPEVFDITGLALYSTDGTTWNESTNSDGSWVGSQIQFIGALPAGGFAAVGNKSHEDDFTLQDGFVWRSADGTDWTSLTQLDGPFSQIMAAALGGPGMVVFAVDESEDDDGNLTSVPHGWFAPLSALGG